MQINQLSMSYLLLFLVLSYAAISLYAVLSNDIDPIYSDTLISEDFGLVHWGTLGFLLICSIASVLYGQYKQEAREARLLAHYQQNSPYDSFRMPPTINTPTKEMRTEEEDMLRMEEEGYKHIDCGAGK